MRRHLGQGVAPLQHTPTNRPVLGDRPVPPGRVRVRGHRVLMCVYDYLLRGRYHDRVGYGAAF